MLARNIRMEEDLVDQLFNGSETRLARTLLLLARYGKPEQTHRVLPRISQETLAEMIGHDALARELLHEQVQEARVHRMQRRPQGQPFHLSVRVHGVLRSWHPTLLNYRSHHR
jgi:hypothetical protein